MSENYCGECEYFDRDNESMDGESRCRMRYENTRCDFEACNWFKQFYETNEDDQ